MCLQYNGWVHSSSSSIQCSLSPESTVFRVVCNLLLMYKKHVPNKRNKKPKEVRRRIPIFVLSFFRSKKIFAHIIYFLRKHSVFLPSVPTSSVDGIFVTRCSAIIVELF